MRIRLVLVGFFLVCAFLPYAQAADKSGQAFANLVKAVKDGNIQDLPGYIDMVGDAKDALATNTLVELLKNKNPVIRWKVYVALGKIGTVASRKAIASGIAGEDKLFWETFKTAIVETDRYATGNILSVGKPLLPQLEKIALDPLIQDKSFVRELIRRVKAGDTKP